MLGSVPCSYKCKDMFASAAMQSMPYLCAQIISAGMICSLAHTASGNDTQSEAFRCKRYLYIWFELSGENLLLVVSFINWLVGDALWEKNDD